MKPTDIVYLLSKTFSLNKRMAEEYSKEQVLIHSMRIPRMISIKPPGPSGGLVTDAMDPLKIAAFLHDINEDRPSLKLKS
jgi:hypothetical protein